MYDGERAEGAGKETYFAPAARAGDGLLQQEIAAVSHNPVVDALLESVPGILAVLDEHRQIVAVNDTMLDLLGIAEAREVLGLRPGEALRCVHAHDHPGGCGTGPACLTCAAAIAIVACLAENRPVQRECSLSLRRQNTQVDLYFQVHCSPITFDGQRFLLLFMRDITLEQQRSILEHVFFHDLNNIVTALLGDCQLLGSRGDMEGLRAFAQRIRTLSVRLAKEIEIQRVLSMQDANAYRMVRQDVSLAGIIGELAGLFADHPAAQGKTLALPEGIPDRSLTTDQALLLRVLTNMLLNAFEATEAGGTVRLWLEEEGQALTFCVWNAQAIPEAFKPRIFQRNCTTKSGPGRGLGTYALRLFGEDYLGGKVMFTSSAAQGTVFRFSLPQAA